MTQYSFNRKYELIVSEPFQELLQDISEYRNTPLENENIVFAGADDYREINKLRNVTIKSLHIEANIEGNNKTSGSKSTTAEIRIFNLNDRSRSIVENVNNYVVLNAGYEDDDELPLIYSGQVSECFTEKQGQDTITILRCKDGYTPNNSIRLSYRKRSGNTYGDIFRDFANIFSNNGIATGELILSQPPNTEGLFIFDSVGYPDEISLTKGYSYTGYLRQAMDDLCEAFNYNWQIVNSSLYIYPKFYREFSATSELSSANILSAKPSQSSQRRTSSSPEVKGLQITTLLNGRLSQTSKVEILDGKNKGTFSIESISHRLSYEGKEWYTIADVVGIE